MPKCHSFHDSLTPRAIVQWLPPLLLCLRYRILFFKARKNRVLCGAGNKNILRSNSLLWSTVHQGQFMEPCWASQLLDHGGLPHMACRFACWCCLPCARSSGEKHDCRRKVRPLPVVSRALSVYPRPQTRGCFRSITEAG